MGFKCYGLWVIYSDVMNLDFRGYNREKGKSWGWSKQINNQVGFTQLRNSSVSLMYPHTHSHTHRVIHFISLVVFVHHLLIFASTSAPLFLSLSSFVLGTNIFLPWKCQLGTHFDILTNHITFITLFCAFRSKFICLIFYLFFNRLN